VSPNEEFSRINVGGLLSARVDEADKENMLDREKMIFTFRRR
jgi:hypothetical protein